MRLSQRKNPRLLALLLLLLLVMIPIGCGASTGISINPVAWLTIESTAVAALVVAIRLPAPTQPEEIHTIGLDTPDIEVWDVLKEHICDLERWENEGGALGAKHR